MLHRYSTGPAHLVPFAVFTPHILQPVCFLVSVVFRLNEHPINATEHSKFTTIWTRVSGNISALVPC